MRSIVIASLFSLFLFFGGCSASKELFEKGVKLESAGLYKESAVLYQKALQSDPTNIDASIALKRVSSKILDEKLEASIDMLNQANYEKSVSLYHEAIEIVKESKKVNVFLEIPSENKRYYQKAKKFHSQAILKEAKEKLDRESFSQAQPLIAEYTKLNPSDKEAKALYDYAYNEPVYRAGIEAMDASDFREAYTKFSKIKTYKDVPDLLTFSKEKGSFAVVFLPIDNFAPVPRAGKTLLTQIKSQILNDKSAFIKIREPDPAGDYKNATYLSKLSALGIQAIFSASIMGSENDNPVKTEQRLGWEEYTYSAYDSKGRKIRKSNYKKVNYLYHKGSRALQLKLEIHVYDTEDQSPWISEVLLEHQADTVEYISYSGNHDKLYLSDPRQVTTISDGSTASNALALLNGILKSALSPPVSGQERRKKELFSGRRNLKTQKELSKVALHNLSSRLAKKLIAYKPKK